MQPSVRTVDLPRTRMQITELGEGMPVILCHGFPGLGYSWRHQMQPIADAGFRAVAPDMLGYGGTDAPADPLEYTHQRVTADLVALIDELGSERAVFVGQDFGAPAAWNVALREPARVAGLALLSVPYEPQRLPQRPTELYAATARDHFLHLHYFQQPGVADAELARDPRGFLARLLFALSGDYRYVDVWQHGSDGNGYLDVLPDAPPLPWSWLTDAELDEMTAVFARTGFTGGLNWYRALDANWADEDYLGRVIDAPALFIAGTNEPVLDFVGDAALARMRDHLRDLRGVHLVEGAGHWVQQERPDQVNALLVDFLTSVDR